MDYIATTGITKAQKQQVITTKSTGFPQCGVMIPAACMECTRNLYGMHPTYKRDPKALSSALFIVHGVRGARV